jgi:tetratricopeptide (TPR) repeat protein
MLQCYERMIEDPIEPEAIRSRGLDLAGRVIDAAARRLPDAGFNERTAVLEAIAAAHLLRAQALVSERRFADALAALDPFERMFSDLPDVLLLGFEKRLRIDLAADAFDRLPATAQAMMQRLPDAAGGAVQTALFELEHRLDVIDGRWLLDPIHPRARSEAKPLADAAFALAKLLRERARALGVTDREALPHDVALARALREQGRAGEAVVILEPLRERFPHHAKVMDELAEALLMRGLKTSDHDVLRTQAAPLYDALITGLAPDAAGRRPPMWWHAWTRRLLIMRITGDYADQIPSRIRGLRLTVDPSLGGEPYRTALQTLERQHHDEP